MSEKISTLKPVMAQTGYSGNLGFAVAPVSEYKRENFPGELADHYVTGGKPMLHTGNGGTSPSGRTLGAYCFAQGYLHSNIDPDAHEALTQNLLAMNNHKGIIETYWRSPPELEALEALKKGWREVGFEDFTGGYIFILNYSGQMFRYHKSAAPKPDQG
ncbi:hypothetical protein [Parahaliea mediterranea]|uniref:hypothetical protein n=1 Tax=Parahaliea mediterranea TaxID=651086 RepID=UPI000E2E8C52|nr:hypothetical protein [Parahaliea mediterranea]